MLSCKKKNCVREVSAVIFSILITTFIIHLPDEQCSPPFFFTTLITLPPIIQMLYLCYFSLPVDFLVMRLIGLVSLFLAKYWALQWFCLKWNWNPQSTSFYFLLYILKVFSYRERSVTVFMVFYSIAILQFHNRNSKKKRKKIILQFCKILDILYIIK